MSDLADAAIRYVTKGIPVFPLVPATKIPLKGTQGWKEASTDLDVVERWWAEGPERNIATVPGWVSMVAVDVDSWEQLEAWTAALAEKGDPGPTRITQSPSDQASRHYWYRSSEPVEFTKFELDLDGVKVLVAGSGQYLLLPPSRHPNGGLYRFLEDRPAAPIPNWLVAAAQAAPRLHPNGLASEEQVQAWLEQASAPVDNEKGREAVAIALGEIAAAKKGSRHETLKGALAGLLNRAAAVDVEINLTYALAMVTGVFDNRFEPGEKRRPWKEVDELLGWIVGQRLESGEEPKNEKPPRVTGVSKKSQQHRVVVHRASDIHPEPVRWLWAGRLPLGGLGLIAGPPGLGKTLVAIELAARISTGTLEGDLFGQAATVLYASAEDSTSTTLVPRLIAAHADLDRVAFIAISEGNGLEESLTFPADTGQLAEAVKESGAKLVVLDPVVAHIATELDSHRDHEVRRVLGPLAHLADETGAHVLGVAHLNKGVGGDFLNRVSGSVGFGAAVRAALGVVVDPADEEESRRILAHVKSNVGARAVAKTFRVRGAAITVDAGVLNTATVEWGDDLPGLSISDLLAPAPDREEREQLTEAERIMLVVLAEGPVRADEARKLVRDGAGVSDRTIDRAKQRLKVDSVRRGGLGAEGWWEWDLPKDVKDAAHMGAVDSDQTGDSANSATHMAGVDSALRGVQGGDFCRCGNPVERFTPAGYPYCETCGPPS